MNERSRPERASLEELIDEALAEDAGVAPRPGFREEVMREVRRAAIPPLPFPWARVATGLALAGAAAALALAAPEGTALALPSVAVLAPGVAILLAVPGLILGRRGAP